MIPFEQLELGKRPVGRWALTADWVVIDTDTGRRLVEHGEVVIEGGRILHAGGPFLGEVSARYDLGRALIAPGFVDLDALSDLDTTTLAMENWPSERKGRVWPQSYVDHGPYEMYSHEELVFQKRFAFGQLLLNGITSAAPIASLFYREWGETVDEFTAAATAANDMGLRVWLGPAYRSGGMIVNDAGCMYAQFDEARGLKGLEAAITFARDWHGHGLVSTMLAPDRVETCTETLLRRTMAVADDLDCPVRLHMAQGQMEADTVAALHGTTSTQWLASIDCLSSRLLAPHATQASDVDLGLYADYGVNVVHCPLVAARHGGILRSFAGLRARGINVAMGTDTAPPDMVLNMALGLVLCRVAEGRLDACRTSDIFDAATQAGAKALNRDDIGVLRPGACADLAVFDMQDARMAPQIDPLQTLLLGASGRVTRATIVDGRLSMRDGEVAGINMTEARVQAQSQFAGLVAKYPERTLYHPPISEIFCSTYPTLKIPSSDS